MTTRRRTGDEWNYERWGKVVLHHLNLVTSANGYFASYYHSHCLLRNHNYDELVLPSAQFGQFEKSMERTAGESDPPNQPADHLDRNNYVFLFKDNGWKLTKGSVNWECFKGVINHETGRI